MKKNSFCLSLIPTGPFWVDAGAFLFLQLHFGHLTVYFKVKTAQNL